MITLWKFCVALGVLMWIILLLSIDNVESRDYTDVTEYATRHIAVDLTTERVHPKWKLSKKRLTKGLTKNY